MRVLLVPETFPPSQSGIAVSALRIVTHLRAAGVEVWAVDFDSRGEFEPGLTVRIDDSREQTIIVTPFFDNQRPVRIPERAKAAARREAALQLAVLARSLGIQLVHSMSVFNAGFIATFVASAIERPHVAGVRGFGRHPFDGLRAECVRWILERATAVVLANRSLFELLAVAHPVEARSAVVIPDSVPALRYPSLDTSGRNAIRAEARAGSDDVLVTIAGNLRERKLLGVSLQALASLPDHPTTRLLILGRVQPAVQEQLDADIRRYRFEDRVVTRDAPPPEELSRWLEASDIVLMPSVDYGTTNIVLEAMERARCVVATDVFAEVIRDGDDGILVDRLDPAALATALAGLSGDSEKRTRLGQRARARVLAERRPDDETRAYVELYERLGAA